MSDLPWNRRSKPIPSTTHVLQCPLHGSAVARTRRQVAGRAPGGSILRRVHDVCNGGLRARGETFLCHFLQLAPEAHDAHAVLGAGAHTRARCRRPRPCARARQAVVTPRV
jgi:hypothetical protein